MLLEFHGRSVNDKHIEKIVSVLKSGGLVVLPTDTLYAVACSIHNNQAVERIARLKKTKPEKANFSFLCADLTDISLYARPFGKEIFRLMKNSLPGPFTFILNASANVPSIFRSNKKTIGIRVPDHPVPREVVRLLGHPLMVTSVHDEEDEMLEYMTQPEEIHERFQNEIEIVADAGSSGFEYSTVIDCTGEVPVVIREGKGEV